jgi:AcrR family transcriptional regulator
VPKGRTRKTPARARRAGDGPVTRNAELSRQEILAAAMHEFASKGVGGARIDQIASRYGGSKNMIYHYYKSKDGLFTAVLETMYATIREHQRDFEIEHSDPATGIRDFVQSTIDVFDRNPEFVTLLHSENIAKARHVARSKAIRTMYSRLLSTVEDLLSRGVAQGLFKVRISAIDLYICICAMAISQKILPDVAKDEIAAGLTHFAKIKYYNVSGLLSKDARNFTVDELVKGGELKQHLKYEDYYLPEFSKVATEKLRAK